MMFVVKYKENEVKILKLLALSILCQWIDEGVTSQ